MSFEPMFGYTHFASKRHLRDREFKGVGLGYAANDRFLVQAEFLQSNTYNRNANDRGVNAKWYLLNGYYFFSPKQAFEPFFRAGVGMMHIDPNGNINTSNPNGTESNRQVSVNLGVGLAYFPHDYLAFKFSVADFYTPTGGKNDLAGLFGMTVYFGGGESSGKPSKNGDGSIEVGPDGHVKPAHDEQIEEQADESIIVGDAGGKPSLYLARRDIGKLAKLSSPKLRA